jgi:TRAP-type C4-dicarboxylate transport system substrate-binding protein
VAADAHDARLTSLNNNREDIMKKLSHVAVGLLALTCSASFAHADDKIITLKVADALPNGHIVHQFILKPFMEGVTQASNGRVAFRHFPAEQLGKAKDMLMLEQSSVADIALTVPSYISDKMALSAAAELPGAFQNVCEAVKAYKMLTRDGEVLAKNEYGANRVKALMSFPTAPSSLVISSARKVGSAGDLAGLKLRTSGGAHDLTVRGLDAVSVRMAPPEVYESMQRGTIDGALFPIASIISYDLTNLIKTGNSTVNFGGIILTYSISEQKWKSLSPDLQKIVADEADKAVLSGCKKLDAAQLDGIKKIEAAGGRFFEFNADDTNKLESVFDEVRKDWASQLDKRGKPGTETLNAWTAAIKMVRANPSN